MPTSRLLLVLSRSTQQEAALQTWLQSVQDANSPNYQKFLSAEDFGTRFGVSDADLQSIQAWLASQGFTVNKVAKGRMAIEFSGSVGQVQSAFHTSIHSYLINGEEQWANASDPQIPSALAPVVAGLASLNSFKPMAHSVRGPGGVYDPQTQMIRPEYTTGNTTNGYYIYVGPSDAAIIYNTPTSFNPNHSGTLYDGTGVTIGIAGVSNIDVNQNANYRATFGLAPNPTQVIVDGNDPGENGAAVEAYLDTEVSGGIAPNASVILYTASDTAYGSGLFYALQRAIDDNHADILSVSFGECEASLLAAGNQYILNLWEQAAAQGISVTVSSGDAGSAGCDNFDTEQSATHGMAVSGYASTPYNISVGGTDFDALYSSFPSSFTNYVNVTNTLANHRSALSYIPEEPWNDSTIVNTTVSANVPLSSRGHSDNIVAGSGGISTIYSVPDWQTSFATGSFRNQPDVSFLAGNGFYGATWGLCTDFDYDMNGNRRTDCVTQTTGNSFNLTGVGGTSASAPAFAGMLALIKQKTGTRLGQADDVLYNLAKTNYATVFHDVNMGDNSVYCQANSSTDCVADAKGYPYLSGYNAGTGYDMASGLGSVNVSQLASNWANAGLIATTSALRLNGATTALNITHGQSVAINANVTGTGGTPSGNIALVDSLSPASRPNSESIADFTLASGSVNGMTTSLPGGSYQVSAHYGGSDSYADSDSNSIPVTVAAESSTTALTIAAYDPLTYLKSATPYYGFIFVLDAQPYGNSASAANPDGVATGTITFKNGSQTLGTATIASNGVAELQTSNIPGGTSSITAVFPGDSSFQGSTSAAYSLTVTPAATSTGWPTYTVAANNSVTLSATVATHSYGAAPTGTVTFMNGSAKLGTGTLTGTASTSTTFASGKATFTTGILPGGTYNISAVYSGDGNYGGSTSLYTTVYISFLPTTLVITPSSATIESNQQVQFTVTPTPTAGMPLPTGSVSLSYNNSVLVPPVNLVNGVATFTIPANTLPLGIDNFFLTYSGDSEYLQASGNFSVTVNSAGTIKPTVTVTAPTTRVTFPYSITVAVSGPSGDATPTGSVTLTDFGIYAASQTMPLTNGSANFTIVGGFGNQNGVSEALTVTYFGDNTYTNGSGTAIVRTLASSLIDFTPSFPTIAVNEPLSTTVTVDTLVGIGAPTGTITLSSGTYTSSPVQLTAAGSASFTIPANSLAVGVPFLQATYSGDANYLAANTNGPIRVTAAAPPGISISGTTVSVLPGATTGNTSTIAITPIGGFIGNVTLTATVMTAPFGAQYIPTLSFNPTVVSVNGSNNSSAILSITTTKPNVAAAVPPKVPGTPWYVTGGATLSCLLLFCIPARRRSWRRLLGMAALLIALSGGVFACGGGSGGGGGGGGNSNPGTTVGSYNITVTGTSGTTTAVGTFTLFVE